jgi:aminomethyltransferase
MIENNSDVRTEYDAIRHGIAVIDFSSAGKLQLSGKNAVQFLNGMVSNDVKALGTGDGVLAAFPNLQGKLVALCRIYNTGAYLLIELEASNREKILKNLSRFVAAGEFFVADVSDQYGLISLQGPRSAEFIESLTGQTVSNQIPYKIWERRIAQTDVLIAVHN